MVTTRPPKTIVKPTALGPVANTDTKLLIYSLFQKGRVLAQDRVRLHSAIGYIAPLDFMDGKATQIWSERDRKLEQARKLQRERRANKVPA